MRTATDLRKELILSHLDRAEKIATSYAMRLPHVDKEDLKGAAALGLVESASRYEHDRRSDFWAYARKRVQGAVQDYLRSETLLSGLRGHYEEAPAIYRDYEVVDPTSPEEEAMEEELLERLREALEYLTERERTVVELMFYEGKSATEIARTLGISEARVSQLKSSSVRKLKGLSAELG